MFRDKHFDIEHINILFDNGGLGDYIANMVAIKYMRDFVPNVIQHVYVPDFFLSLAKNLVPGVIIIPFSEAKKKYNEKLTGFKMSIDFHSPMRTHLVDFAFNAFVDKQVDVSHKNYCKLNTSNVDINKFDLPSKYVVLTTGFTAEVREMLPHIANNIISYCKSKGYEVVLLGNESAKNGKGGSIKGNFKPEIDKEKCINLINKTNLLEAGKIIEEGKVIIGLDNGLLHLAGCTETPIVGGYSTVAPELRLPYRHYTLGWNCYSVTPNEDLACRFCQSEFVHVFDHSFTKCYYGDKICLSQMTADKYIKHLEKIL